MTKQRVSINGITRWKEVDTTPKKAAPAVEEAKVVPLRQAIGEVLRDIRQRQGRTCVRCPSVHVFLLATSVR